MLKHNLGNTIRKYTSQTQYEQHQTETPILTPNTRATILKHKYQTTLWNTIINHKTKHDTKTLYESTGTKTQH